MKKYVWLAGLLLLASIVFPRGFQLPKVPVIPPAPTPIPAPVNPDPAGPVDAQLAAVLGPAAPEDKARVIGIYSGLRDVIKRDGGKLVKTTEQWATLQERALQLAVADTPVKGKYANLDVLLEGVFVAQLGAEKEVSPADPATREKIITACTIIINSAR